MKMTIPKPLRCAIYTRKSTEHNLDLAFNSLDAQREACEAYIKSQAHEGWRLLPRPGHLPGLRFFLGMEACASAHGWSLKSVSTPAARRAAKNSVLGYRAISEKQSP